ncbi:helix-turn-helix family protein [Clostridium argentinense CDC 2741]|uniref:Helix-turn-helix family protein n=1 Tax=Clostridium argentinense CDC 2741 TaxID=1418104 RepID=A0A0C1U5R5_9CLOT|nr:helix-turn-helix transcriptional regulator [Clostridium argentinense]ARC85624.1 transcriptional regulator [Clostridium argentinense]KIE47088.1 helix-turn-helix family protein [Clostridium argentinense CDC 2741]NFF40856.1 helix-turn-helix transcriptional regulator [Clostridium argentinense]NFP50788.1 helix-turn-helix transcriptional regulator [Clostridium argentinense]NFP73055.1 helix-turn-helix transcriptional regulator [Clostridium argentinense]
MGADSKFDLRKEFLPIIYNKNDTQNNTPGTKLRELRLKNNITQKQLAEKTSISEITIMHVEQNKIDVPYYYWKKICDYFGVNHIKYLKLYTLKEDSIQDKLKKLRVYLGAKNWREVGEYLGYSEGFTYDLFTRYIPNANHLKVVNSALDKFKKTID